MANHSFWIVVMLTPFLMERSSTAQDESQQLFRSMESKFRASDTINIRSILNQESFSSDSSSIQRRKTSVHLIMRHGQKVHLLTEDLWSVDGASQNQGPISRSEFVSNGKMLRFVSQHWTEPLVWITQDIPKDWSDSLLNALVYFETGKGFKVAAQNAIPEGMGPVSSSRTKGREKYGDHDLAVIEYSIPTPSLLESSRTLATHVALWIDTHTNLPIKREVRQKAGGWETLTTEIFESIILDGALSSETFDLPKDPIVRNPEMPSESEFASKMKILSPLLSANDPEIRGNAEVELARLGHKAIPMLNSQLGTGDLEFRGRLVSTIDRIYQSDCLFLVRSPLRQTTFHGKDKPLRLVLSEISAPFAYFPSVALPINGQNSIRVTLDLDRALFWDAVRHFSELSGLPICISDDGNRLEFGSSESGLFTCSHGEGPLAVLAAAHAEPATKDREFELLRLDFRLFVEPGWVPISASLEVSSIKNQEGKEIRAAFGDKARVESDIQENSRILSCPQISHLDLNGRFSKIPSDGKLTVRGTAKVTLVTGIESAEFMIEGFKQEQQKAIAAMRIQMNVLEADDTSVRLLDGISGPRGWTSPPDKPYSGQIWVLATDNRGHSVYMGNRSYSGSGSVGQTVKWPFAAHARKVAYIRPIETEILEFPFVVEAIPITRDD